MQSLFNNIMIMNQGQTDIACPGIAGFCLCSHITSGHHTNGGVLP